MPKKIILSLAAAVLTGLAAQIKFQLPWTPVPITGQTFAVLLSGILLGKWWGGISQTFYAVLGFIGVPWFAGLKGGISVLMGPTSGYIFGFILAAFFIGYCSDKYIKARGFWVMAALMLFANFVLIHIPGLIILYSWLVIIKGASPTMLEVFNLGTLPFIFGDVLKIILAASLVKGITPKKAYNGEADKKN